MFGWLRRTAPETKKVELPVGIAEAQIFWRTQLEWVVQQMNARDVLNAKPLRQAIVRLNERFDALGENIDLRHELGALRSEIDLLRRDMEDLRSQMLARDNAQVETDADRAMYAEMGIKDET